MIVDTMTFDEMTTHLIRTTFSSENVEKVIQKYVKPHSKIYRREMIKWNKNLAHSQYRIFEPIVSKRDFEEELVLIPYCANKNYLDHILFTQFHYQGKKYVAFKLTIDKVFYYTSHCIDRYSERFLDEFNPVKDNIFIGDMLIYNSGYIKTKYFYKGRMTNMFVSTDGGFLCEEFEKSILAHTFISKKEYFDNQKELDASAFDELKRIKKKKYGYWLEKG